MPRRRARLARARARERLAAPPPARPPSSPPRCRAELLAVDDRGAREAPLVRRPLDSTIRVRHVPAASRASTSCSSVLWSTCVRERVLDPLARTRRRPPPRSRSKPCSRKSAPSAASSSAASTLRLRDEPLELLLAGARRRRARARRSPRPSSRATTAQVARETTCERTFASCPSEKSGCARRAHARSPARGRCRRGTRAARTRRPVGRPRRVGEDVLRRSGGSSSISCARARARSRYWCEVT